MLLKDRKAAIFWTIMVFLYALSIYLSYNRIYVRADYPIFYTEDELPDPLEDFKHFLKLDRV